eukprot:1496470-Pyramimonas_sp.AAC.1
MRRRILTSTVANKGDDQRASPPAIWPEAGKQAVKIIEEGRRESHGAISRWKGGSPVAHRLPP